MATESRTLEIVAKVRDLATKEFQRMSSVVGRVATSMTRGFQGFVKQLLSVRTLIAGFLAGAAIQRVVGAITGVADSLDRLGKQARRLGLPVEELNGLRYAAELSGVQVDNLEAGLKDLRVRSAQAANGQQELLKAFTQLGINIRDTSGRLKTQTELLDEIADAYVATGGSARTVEQIMRVLGEESGPQMLTMLEGGSKALRQMREEAQRLNPVTEKQTRLAEQFNDALARLWAQSRQVLMRALLPLIEQLIPRIEELTQKILANAKAIAEAITGTFEFLTKVGRAFTNIPRSLDAIVQTLGFKMIQGQIRDLRREIEHLEAVRARNEARRGSATFESGTAADVERRLSAARDRLAELERVGAERARQIIEFNREVSGETREVAKAMQSLPADPVAALAGEPSEQQRALTFLDGLRQAHEQLRIQMGGAFEAGLQAGTELIQTLSSGLAGAMRIVRTETGSMRRAFSEWGLSLLDTLAQIIERMLAMRIVMAAFSFLGGGAPASGGIGGAVGSGGTFVGRTLGAGLGGPGLTPSGFGGGRGFVPSGGGDTIIYHDNRPVMVNATGPANISPAEFEARVQQGVAKALAERPAFAATMRRRLR